MPYAFAPRTRSAYGQVDRWDVPINRWLDVKYGLGEHGTIFGALERYTEDSIYDSPDTIQPELANSLFGIPGQLEFKDPISIQHARIRRERKDEELRRLAYLNSATHSAFSIKAAAGLGSAIVGGVSNPLDLSLMFVPVVGSARAAGIAKLGRASRLGVAIERGLITEEALGTATRFPGFSGSVINATAGAAITEIPVFAQAVRDQEIYGFQDALTNVALGGVTGGILHGISAGVRRLFLGAAEAHSRMSPDVQEAALRKVINDALADRPLETEGITGTDTRVIARDLQFSEAEVRRKAFEDIGVGPEEARIRSQLEQLNVRQASATDLLDLARAKLNTDAASVSGKIVGKLMSRFEKGDRSVDLFQNLASLFDLRYNPLAPTLQERFKEGLLVGEFDEVVSGKNVAASFKRSSEELFNVQRVIKENLDAISKTTDENLQRQLRTNVDALQRRRDQLFNEVEQSRKLLAERRSPLSAEEIDAHAKELQKRGVQLDDAETRAGLEQAMAHAEEVRAARIEAYVAAERSRFEANKPTETVTVEDRPEPPLATPEEVKSNSDPTGGADINELVSSLKQSLETPTGDAILDKLIMKELSKLEDGPKLGSGFEAAANCLIGGL